MDFLLRDRSPPRGDRLPIVPEMLQNIHTVKSKTTGYRTTRAHRFCSCCCGNLLTNLGCKDGDLTCSVPGFAPGQLDPVHLDAKFSDIDLNKDIHTSAQKVQVLIYSFAILLVFVIAEVLAKCRRLCSCRGW